MVALAPPDPAYTNVELADDTLTSLEHLHDLTRDLDTIKALADKYGASWGDNIRRKIEEAIRETNALIASDVYTAARLQNLV